MGGAEAIPGPAVGAGDRSAVLCLIKMLPDLVSLVLPVYRVFLLEGWDVLVGVT